MAVGYTDTREGIDGLGMLVQGAVLGGGIKRPEDLTSRHIFRNVKFEAPWGDLRRPSDLRRVSSGATRRLGPRLISFAWSANFRDCSRTRWRDNDALPEFLRIRRLPCLRAAHLQLLRHGERDASRSDHPSAYVLANTFSVLGDLVGATCEAVRRQTRAVAERRVIMGTLPAINARIWVAGLGRHRTMEPRRRRRKYAQNHTGGVGTRSASSPRGAPSAQLGQAPPP